MATDSIASEQIEVIATFPFTTLEGLFQSLKLIEHEHPDIGRGEIHLVDRNGLPFCQMQLVRNILPNGQLTIDAVIGRGSVVSTML